ncbi:MAG TPA: hypothetical protein VFW11_05915 [Cyclobacteriaceae bacterium]|nr:hypothetical protein [Cyclobacteriaceae bacterium]
MKLFLSIFLVFLMLSCTDRKDDIKEEPEVSDATPEALERDKSEFQLRSLGKRYSENIIEELFREAMESDSQLGKLVEDYDQLTEAKSDSLEEYIDYKQNNIRYWSATERYISQLSDSTLKHEMKSAFDVLKKKYDDRISNHELALNELAKKEQMLKDLEIIMKLMVTEPMMSNYQRNEIPGVTTIHGVSKGYDTLISRTRKYTTIKK